MIYVATYYDKIRTSKMAQNVASDPPESDDINSKVYAPRPLTEYQVPLTAELPLVTTYHIVQNIRGTGKTFAVRSPCEYLRKNFCGCIKNFLILVIALENSWAKHLRFKVKLRNPRMFCPSNVLFYIYGIWLTTQNLLYRGTCDTMLGLPTFKLLPTILNF